MTSAPGVRTTSREMESAYLETVKRLVIPHFKTLAGYKGAWFMKRAIAGG